MVHTIEKLDLRGGIPLEDVSNSQVRGELATLEVIH